jgi:cyclohexadienyl dehydratase
VFVTESAEAITQQKLKPGLCAVNPDKPLQYGEMACICCRATTWPSRPTSTSGCTWQQAGGDYQRVWTAG